MPVLFAIVLIDLIGFGIVIPLLPFFGERFGASPQLVTLLMATYSFFQLFMAPLWGRVSDRHGRRPVLLLSLLGMVAGYLWLGFADALWMLFAARALQGTMAGNIAAAQAYVADVTTPENRAKGMGLIGAAFGLGFIIGPALGGLLAGPDPAAPAVAAPAFLGAGLSALALLGTLLFLKESLPAAARGRVRTGRLAAVSKAVRRAELRQLLLVFFVVTFAFAGMETTFALWANRQFAWGAAQVGYVLTFVGVLSALVQGGLIGRLTRRFGEEQVLIAGTGAILLGLIAIPFATSLAILLGATALLALGMGLTQPSLNSLVSRQSGAHEQGEVMGVAQSTGSLARILGPALAGFLFGHYGRNAPYYAGAVLLLFVHILAHRLRRRDEPLLAPKSPQAR
ncbi:MAG TPA: MFS transporter [Stellaceae bacterium]|nr:MFS transporter [Stellaceae bacterium]